MQVLLWKVEYETDDSVLDAQHRTLFRMLQELQAAMLSERGAIKEKVSAFAGFIDEQLASEERLMQSTGYPEMPIHRRRHEFLRMKVRELASAMGEASEGAGSAAPQSFAHFYAEHIVSEDKRMVQWVRSHGGALAGSGYWAVRDSLKLAIAPGKPSDPALQKGRS